MEVSKKEEWLKNRTTGIGGSDSSVILGINPWKSKLELWTEKTTGVTIEKDNISLRLGKKLEPFIIEEYVELTKRDVEAGTIALENMRSKEYPYMICNLDGRITDDTRGKGVLECKIKGAFVRWDEDIPSYYYCQIQHCLAVADYTWASFAVLNFTTNQLEWKDIERDEEFIKKLIEEESKFWKLVESGTPPEIENTKSCENFLRDKYSEGSERKTIDLRNNQDATDWAVILRCTKEQMEQLKEKELLCKNNFMSVMRDAEIGIGKGYSISWKSPKDKNVFDIERFQKEHPKLYKEYINKEKQKRRFTVRFNDNE
ncbi:MAG: YqaJ viral recombinase family protein [Candidatus Dojkabacteria bacterium]|nr:YqaJ viral recombinase family protein [Candidatus Dojkabacteria bacterium]